MKRTVTKEATAPQLYEAQLNAMALMAIRNTWATKLGIQFGGDRDLYKALGYPSELTYLDYLAKFKRHDISRAVITRPVGATWRGILKLEETEKKDATEFETAWEALRDNLKLKQCFVRTDILSSLGRYSVILLGFNDIRGRSTDEYMNKVRPSAKLLYVKPFSEYYAKVDSFDSDMTSFRYGQPEMYSIDIQSGESTTTTVKVHHSRVIHIVQNPLESDIEGTPALESIYNRLMDLEKIVGGDGEMFWKGARPGYTGKVDENYMLSPKAKKDLENQISDYENNMSRFLINAGVELKGLEQQLSDPKNHVDIQIQMISAEKGIPKRILTGSERGELSSAQDSQEWRAYIQERREETAEIYIVRPFVQRMIDQGILPEPESGKYDVVWPNGFDLNPKEKSEVGKNRAEAIKAYTTNPIAETIIPPEPFMQLMLGLEQEEIDWINMSIDKTMHDDALMRALDPQEGVQQETSPVNKAKQKVITRRTKFSNGK
jgi:hypothetical protein